jgi:hypothetical protein
MDLPSIPNGSRKPVQFANKVASFFFGIQFLGHATLAENGVGHGHEQKEAQGYFPPGFHGGSSRSESGRRKTNPKKLIKIRFSISIFGNFDVLCSWSSTDFEVKVKLMARGTVYRAHFPTTTLTEF